MTREHEEPGLRSLLHEDLETYGRQRRHAGYRALRIYRLGTWRDELRPGLRRKVLGVPYDVARRRIRDQHHIELHHTASIGRRVRLSGHGGIVIGNESVLGDDCEVGPDVTMAKTKVGIPGRPVIGDCVVIGPGAVFVGGVNVGHGAIIGPNVVVFADVPANTALMAPQTLLAARVVDEGSPTGQPTASSELTPGDLPPGSQIRGRVYVSATAPPRIEGPVELGDGCVLEERAFLGWTQSDGSNGAGTPTRLGARVRIGAGAVVLRGVSIGDDSHVGPNAVVDVDVPPGAEVTSPTARVFGGR